MKPSKEEKIENLLHLYNLYGNWAEVSRRLHVSERVLREWKSGTNSISDMANAFIQRLVADERRKIEN